MKAELVPENGDLPIPITRDVTVVGRRDYCDVKIDDPSLSKRHCVLVKTDGLLVVRDLATTNGTKVKGQRVRWAALLPDDRLTLGGYKVRVYLGPDDMPSPSERPRAQGKAVARAVADRAAPVVAPLPVAPLPAAIPAPVDGILASGGEFATPSPLDLPAVNGAAHDGLELVDDESDSDWRHLIASRSQRQAGGDDLLIELD
jgi:predicted component of type VI protein secretion system